MSEEDGAVSVEIWERLGRPAVVTPATVSASKLMPFVGDLMYGLIDEWKVSDVDLAPLWKAVEEDAAQAADPVFGGCLEYAPEAELLAALRPLSMAERYSAIALNEGLIDGEIAGPSE